MIISHKYKFIFIKTIKTAGTSIEAYLSKQCGSDDILTPIYPPVEGHEPRNWQGVYNPLPDFLYDGIGRWSLNARRFLSGEKYFSHIPAYLVSKRVGCEIWNSYTKFCVERDPLSKILSHYSMVNYRAGNRISTDEYINRQNFPHNSRIYTNKENEIMVDHILRFEDLNNELGRLLSYLNIPFSGELGISAKAEYRPDRRVPEEVFDDSQVQMIRNYFQEESELINSFGLGFKFKDGA